MDGTGDKDERGSGGVTKLKLKIKNYERVIKEIKKQLNCYKQEIA